MPALLSFKVMYQGGSDILGAGAVAAGFRLASTTNLRRALADMTPELEQVRTRFMEMERAWFDSAGEGSWVALKASTQARKASIGAPENPLVREGSLLRSLTEGGPDAVQDITTHSLRFGTRVAHASRHDLGFTHLGGQRVEARRPIPRRAEHPQMFAFIKSTIQAGLAERARASR